MNEIKTTPRGFPFDELALAEIQEQTVPPINAIAQLIPDNSIVWGCQISNALNISNGFIIWDGELMPFVGGQLASQFSIINEVVTRAFNIGTDQDPQLEDHPAYIKRYAKLGAVEGAESLHSMSGLRPAPRFLTYLKKGRRFCGTVVPQSIVIGEQQVGTVINIAFDSIRISNYLVMGNFYRANTQSQGSFEYDVFAKTPTGFSVRIKNISEPISQLIFEYLVIPPETSTLVTTP